MKSIKIFKLDRFSAFPPDKVVSRISLSYPQCVFILLISMIAYKLSLEIAYIYILSSDEIFYPLNINPYKYLIGIIWILVIFFSINHDENKTSSFFIYFIYLFQIIPITVVYAMANQSSSYYFTLCSAFLLCILILKGEGSSEIGLVSKIQINYRLFLFASLAIVVTLLLNIFVLNGFPTLTALNLFDVYELRGSDKFKIGKYFVYLLNYSTKIFIPFLIVISLKFHNWFVLGFSLLSQFTLFLYTGHKTYLFSIPLILIITLWSKRNFFYYKFFSVLCSAIVLLVFLTFFSSYLENFWDKSFSLFVRRTLMVPAVNKFNYFDFFTHNPKIGFAGMFPRWLIQVENPYDNKIGHIIGNIYYNRPETNANTGFMAEGYMRFGYVGTYLILALYGLMLRFIDGFQRYNGYSCTLGLFIYIIYISTDGHFLDSLIFGYWMIAVIFILFFKSKSKISKYSLKFNYLRFNQEDNFTKMD